MVAKITAKPSAFETDKSGRKYARRRRKEFLCTLRSQ
jgi:hypothetical protein